MLQYWPVTWGGLNSQQCQKLLTASPSKKKKKNCYTPPKKEKRKKERKRKQTMNSVKDSQEKTEDFFHFLKTLFVLGLPKYQNDFKGWRHICVWSSGILSFKPTLMYSYEFPWSFKPTLMCRPSYEFEFLESCWSLAANNVVWQLQHCLKISVQKFRCGVQGNFQNNLCGVICEVRQHYMVKPGNQGVGQN